MERILVIGAGTIGSAIARLLQASGDYAVTVADRDEALLTDLPAGVRGIVADAARPAALGDALHGQDVVVSACPFFLNAGIAEAAREAGAHYFDLTEDVATTVAIRAIARGADTAFVPQCGLAPGFVGIAAHDLARRFDSVREIRMRVGALPLYPVNALRYALTWSTDGLINEYCNPCDAILDGTRSAVLPLEGLERFSLDGVEYEAFNTSGGLGTLCETWAGRVETLTYKTVRYPGHRDAMKLLLDDLRLRERRDLLREVLESAVPETAQDVVLILVTAIGMRRGRLVQESVARKVQANTRGGADGHETSAIQTTTATGLCAMLDLMREGRLPQRGFIRQEQAELDGVLANRFGRVYAGS